MSEPVHALRPDGAAPSIWVRLAGLAVLVDGVLALLVAGLFVVFTVVPFVGHVEGREPVDQSYGLQALLALVVAIVGIWAGQRALRGIHRGRLWGVAVAAIAGAWVVSLTIGSSGSTLEAIAIVAAIVGAQAWAAVTLARWRTRADHEPAGWVAGHAEG